jgi:hypothetical protein
MEEIIQWYFLVIGDHLQLVFKYISVQSKNLAREELILNVSSDIKEECAINAIEMHLMEIYMEKLEHLIAKFVLISECNLFKALL